MYKILIVDDDLLARIGMKTLIDWQAYGFEVIGTADSGEQALEMMEQELPHVVFTDVVMYGMDGIELTRCIKTRYPAVLVVALSCYTDVDYVKSIIRMGAEDYLQKLSMRPEDVVTMLEGLKAKLEEQGCAEVSGEEKRRADLLLKSVRGERGPDFSLLEPEHGRPMRLMAIRRLTELSGVAQKLDGAAGALKKRGICWARYREDLLAALVPDAPMAELIQLSEQILSEAHALGRQTGDWRTGALCIGFSQQFSGTGEIRRHFCRAGEASMAAYLNWQERVFFDRREEESALASLYSQHKRICCLMDEGDLAGVIAQVPELTRRMKQLESQTVLCRQMYTSLFSRLTQLEVTQGIKVETPGLNVEKLASVEESERMFTDRVAVLSARIRHSPGRYRQEVKRAIAYIEEHYQEDVTLAHVALHVSMSESHLSSIFKKETGRGFANYLEEERIAHAVRLMASSREPLYVIAQKVGYYNVNYFSRVFKKVRGETPSQFLKRQKL